MADSRFAIEWRDAGCEPECQPNPDYPEGVDVDGAFGAEACKADLSYPAKRCGMFVVECRLCGARLALTTAGRPDDPRSVTVPCKSIFGRPN